MPPHLQQPNAECSDCPKGNRFMKHFRTVRQRVPVMGTEEPEYDDIAIYRCEKCGRFKQEAIPAP